MKPKVLNYDETCINKNAFHNTATSINIDEVEINKILTGYTKHFDNNNKYVTLLVNKKKLLKI